MEHGSFCTYLNWRKGLAQILPPKMWWRPQWCRVTDAAQIALTDAAETHVAQAWHCCRPCWSWWYVTAWTGQRFKTHTEPRGKCTYNVLCGVTSQQRHARSASSAPAATPGYDGPSVQGWKFETSSKLGASAGWWCGYHSLAKSFMSFRPQGTVRREKCATLRTQCAMAAEWRNVAQSRKSQEKSQDWGTLRRKVHLWLQQPWWCI